MKKYEPAINQKTKQAYLWDDPELQWDDVHYDMSDYEEMFDEVLQYMEDKATEFEKSLAGNNNERIINKLEREFSKIPVRRIDSFEVDEQINSNTIEDLIEIHDITDDDMVNIINVALKKKVKHFIEYGVDVNAPVSRKGIAFHWENADSVKHTYNMNLQKTLRISATSFTLLDFFRKIDSIDLEDYDEGKQLDGLIEYSFEDLFWNDSLDVREFKKTIDSVVQGKKPKFARIHIEQELDGEVIFAIEEREILPFILDHIFPTKKGRR